MKRNYRYDLPPVRHLLSLASDTQFPATRHDISRNAARWGFTQTMLDFLYLFPENEVFKSRVDFMTRCEELELLLGQERALPKERLSPQD